MADDQAQALDNGPSVVQMGQSKRHWLVRTDALTRDVVEVAFTEAEVQEYRDAGWSVEGPFVAAAQLEGVVAVRDALIRIGTAAFWASPNSVVGKMDLALREAIEAVLDAIAPDEERHAR